MANIALAATFGVTFPDTGVAFQLAVRWTHLIAGITWIGLLFFFNLVNASFMKSLPPETSAKVFPGLMSRAMAWFRWSALLAVAAGVFYWAYFIILPEARNARAHGIDSTGRMTLLWFLVFWTAAFLIEFIVLVLPVDALKSGPVLGIIVALVVVGAAYGWLSLNSHAWESSRLQSIGIGGGIGWFMLLNTWAVMWPSHKKLIKWGASGTPMPAQAAQVSRQALIISRITFFLSFPMILFMAAASHFPFLVD